VDSDFKVDTFTFYNPYGGSSGIGCAFTVSWTNASGQTSTKNISQGASINFVKPTVDEFISRFLIDEVQSEEPAIGIRNDKDGDPVLQFGEVEHVLSSGQKVLLPGIMWQATVTPTPYAGGEIAFVQLVNTVRELTFAVDTSVQSTHGQYYLDNQFPYCSGPVGSELIGKDSPGVGLKDKKTGASVMSAQVEDHFKTYLMYKPSGSDSIWVSLSMLTWFWKATADKQPDGTWEVGTPPDSIFDATPRVDTSVLPEWNGYVKNLS